MQNYYTQKKKKAIPCAYMCSKGNSDCSVSLPVRQSLCGHENEYFERIQNSYGFILQCIGNKINEKMHASQNKNHTELIVKREIFALHPKLSNKTEPLQKKGLFSLNLVTSVSYLFCIIKYSGNPLPALHSTQGLHFLEH